MKLSTRRRRILVSGLSLLCAAGLTSFAPTSLAATARALAARGTDEIPDRLSDQSFWRLVREFSEESGFFQSDNFVSNETTYQFVIPTLQHDLGQGGVYVGVGPDQNFTYIVALEPRISFIVDIRRGAMLQHLLYKALIELSRDRADFLSLLFSRARPAGLSDSSSAAALFDAYYLQAPDSAAYYRNFAAVKHRLATVHGFQLSNDDYENIEYIYTSFYNAGPDITYNYGMGRGGFGSRGMPTYAQLMVADDGAGAQRSYLATESNFRTLKDLQTRNLIVPVVGNFGGPKALRAVGQFLRENGATLRAFYTSNVEQYLFREPALWRAFYSSVATFPVDSNSVFIRASFNQMGYGSFNGYGPRSATVLSSINETIKAFSEGRIQTYLDVLNMSR